MRLYTFCNTYLSSIQNGIQPAHLVGDLFVKYMLKPGAADAQRALLDWAQHHKTMICLNGGNLASIQAVAAQLERIGEVLGLPTASFHEDEASLGGIMTCTGIVVPELIYELAAEMRSGASGEITSQTNDAELQLIDLLNSFGLAK